MDTNAVEEFHNDDAVEAMHQMETQMRRCDEENSALRLIKKDVKNRGHDVQAMLRAIKNRKKGAEKTIGDMRSEIKYSGLQRLPLTPETLFDLMDFTVTEKTRQGQDIWDAEEHGYQSGLHGVDIREAPYPPGTELFMHWHTWWMKGDAAREKARGPDATEATAARRPRKRQERFELPEFARRRPVRRRSPQIAENGATVY